MTEQDYCVEEEANKCEGCIYRISGERRDKQGYVLKTSACLCEEEMAAGCAPEYQFPDHYIFEGKMRVTKKGLISFKHKGKLKPNVVRTLVNHLGKGEKET